MRLHLKIIMLVTCVSVGIGGFSAMVASRIMKTNMKIKLEQQTLTIAKVMCEHITHNVIAKEIIPAREALMDMVRRNDDIEFIYITDFDRKVFAHSFEGDFPRALLENPYERVSADKPLVRRYETGQAFLLDLAYPLIDGLDADIHVVMNEGYTFEYANSIRNRILAFTLIITVIGICVGVFMSRRITGSLAGLAVSMHEFGQKGIYNKLNPTGQGGEVDDLTNSFNTMIDDRKQAEEALQESEDRFRDFFANAPIGFHIFGPDQIITDTNDAELDMIGYTRDEIVGKKTWADLIVPDQKKLFEKHWHEITTKGKVSNLEYKLVHKQGHHIDVILNASSRFDASGQLINTRGSILNITKRKQAEIEREKLLKTVTAKNKELQSIVYVASHDLRSPLVNIEGFGGELANSCQQLEELMRDAVFDETKAKEASTLINEYIPESLKFIKAGTAKMSSLLTGLLQVSRVGSKEVDIKPLDMNKIMNNVRHSMEFQIKDTGAELTIEDMPNCLGDGDMINQVFSNLIGNALKYLDPDRKGKIHISGRIEDGNGIYCVTDNGIGINPAHQGKIFELFHRLNPADTTGGEGLGLTIVTRILDRLNGSIRVESEPGNGSKFFVSLPTAKP